MAVVLNYTLFFNRGLFLVCEHVQLKLHSSNKGCFQRRVSEMAVNGGAAFFNNMFLRFVAN